MPLVLLGLVAGCQDTPWRAGETAATDTSSRPHGGGRPHGGDTDTSDDTAHDTAGATDTVPQGDCDDPLLAWIPPGTFTMGSPDGEVGRDADETQHEVTLTRALCVAVHEVTDSDFETWMGYAPSRSSACGGCPVETLSWHEAAAYTNRLSDAHGLPPCYTCAGEVDGVSCEEAGSPYDCAGYRLPTEAEWEYATRAGQTGALAGGGNLLPGDESDCEGGLVLDNGLVLDDYAWYCGSGSSTHAVGRLEENDWGLADLPGNVAEWCHDGYAAYGATVVDPIGPAGAERIVRGGHWDAYPSSVRAAARGAREPGYRGTDVGFRFVRTGS